MESRVKLFGHSVHQMLIALPLGTLSVAPLFDAARLLSGDRRWGEVALRDIEAGLLGGLLAAPFGLIDWLAIPPKTRARRIGALHGLGNLGVVGLFGGSWLLRRLSRRGGGVAAAALALLGTGLAVWTGWLGGELVDRLGVGVDDGAHLDAPSSLTDPGDGRRAGGAWCAPAGSTLGNPLR